MWYRMTRRYYGKEYSLNGYYHDFFGYFDLYKFDSEKKRDEWVDRYPYWRGSGRMVASGNDYAHDTGEHKTTMIKYLF